MITKNINLKGLTRGDTICFAIKGKGVTQDVTDAYFSVKKFVDDTEYLIQKKLGNGITQEEKGLWIVRLAPSDTYNLSLDTYFYDVQLNFGEDTITPMKGKFELTYDITREEF